MLGFTHFLGMFMQSGDSETPLRLAIINEFRSTQPTILHLISMGLLFFHPSTLSHLIRLAILPALSSDARPKTQKPLEYTQSASGVPPHVQSGVAPLHGPANPSTS